ncbi:hypothetical protein [Blastochloris sulfoviridis]|uniref:Uncharacterized protein n=1 Tax=Blastochloris sulfoviridis TaxID=50712 RepID=A0A5M6HJE7_9HYPH|nr:hypothetical protein [Blastochloris sulfoviridis]KAA5595921.1 hypothetical protein F1193_16175 [Blastochloris sulfoviridis]
MSESQPGVQQRPDPLAEEPNLDEKYRRIGISAVAAAARYAGPLRNEDHAPAPDRSKLTTDQMLLLG